MRGIEDATNAKEGGPAPPKFAVPHPVPGGKRKDDTDLNDSAQQRARTDEEETQTVKSFDPESPPASEAGDFHSQTANAPPMRTKVQKRQYLYWIDIAPDLSEELTQAQKESAIKINIKDLAACAALPLLEMRMTDEDYPDHFIQTGTTTTEGDLIIKGISVALPSHEARAKYVKYTEGALLVSTAEEADDADKQIRYTVKVHSAQPEFAHALLRKESAHLVIYMRGAPFHVGQVEMRHVIEEQLQGIKIVHAPRRGTELDEHGRPLRGIIGTKPEMHARIVRTGGSFYLPRCLHIESHPFRYSVSEGHFKVSGKDLCNRCHQAPCECTELDEDVKRALEYKAAARGKKKTYTQQRNNNSAGASSGPSDIRFDLMATRGKKGAEAVVKATRKQKATPCRNFFGPTGKCAFGNKCKFSHGGYDGRCYSCYKHANERKANEPMRRTTTQ